MRVGGDHYYCSVYRNSAVGNPVQLARLQHRKGRSKIGVPLNENCTFHFDININEVKDEAISPSLSFVTRQNDSPI